MLLFIEVFDYRQENVDGKNVVDIYMICLQVLDTNKPWLLP